MNRRRRGPLEFACGPPRAGNAAERERSLGLDGLSASRNPIQGGRANMRIGVLTGGGDCPGLNAVIRAVVRKGIEVYGHEFIGFKDGWRGPMEGRSKPLGLEDVEHILTLGGTILRSSRTNPYKIDGGAVQIKQVLADQRIDAL